MVEAYSPLVRGQKGDDATLTKLAEHHKKSPAQILIRYCLQKDWVPLPKSDTPSRIEENADVYDFHLSDDDMKTLDDLDQGEKGSIGVYFCSPTSYRFFFLLLSLSLSLSLSVVVRHCRKRVGVFIFLPETLPADPLRGSVCREELTSCAKGTIFADPRN